MKLSRVAFTSFVLALVLTACGAADPAGEQERELTTETAVPNTESDVDQRETDTPESTDPAPLERVGGEDATLMSEDAIRDDFSARRNVPLSSVRVVLQEEVTWPNGALGCPEPGMSYTQALVSGSRIVVTDGTTEGAYHAGDNGEYAYCEEPTAPAAGAGDA